MTQQCAISSCNNPHEARGFCNRHYKRWKSGAIAKHSDLCAVCNKPVAPPLRRYCSLDCRNDSDRARYRHHALAYHYRNRDRENAKHRAYRLRADFGISEQDYDRLLEVQNGGCAICKQKCSSGRRLAVDHDHKTGVVRGLLCGHCNTGLGKFRDDPSLLKTAAAYLHGTAGHGLIGT